MMADSHVIKTEIAQHVFGLLDHEELTFGHPFPVRNAGTKTRHLRFVGCGQAEFSRELANLGLGEANFFERRTDLELYGSLGAGPEIPHVARVFTVGDHCEPLSFGQRGKSGEEFVFAEIAAVIGIGEVSGIFELLRAHNPHRELKLFGGGQRGSQFAARQTRGIRNNGQRFLAKNLVGDAGKEDRIDAAGISHEA